MRLYMNQVFFSVFAAKKNDLAWIVVALAILMGLYSLNQEALNFSDGDDSRSETRTVAWYVANIKEAKAVNKICWSRSDPSLSLGSENCEMALRALNLSHVGSNYQN
jgi:hypothetical protein